MILLSDSSGPEITGFLVVKIPHSLSLSNTREVLITVGRPRRGLNGYIRLVVAVSDTSTSSTPHTTNMKLVSTN